MNGYWRKTNNNDKLRLLQEYIHVRVKFILNNDIHRTAILFRNWRCASNPQLDTKEIHTIS